MEQRYFIGSLLENPRGGLALEHRTIDKNLNDFFGFELLHVHVPPHITFVPPFTASPQVAFRIMQKIESASKSFETSYMRRVGLIDLYHNGEISCGWHFKPDKESRAVIKKIYEIVAGFSVSLSKSYDDVVANLHATLIKVVESTENKVLFNRATDYIDRHYPTDTGEVVLDINLFLKATEKRGNGWAVKHTVEISDKSPF